MRTFQLILLITVVAHFCAQAESTRGGNGGGAITCRNAKGEITKAVLLELWEGANEPRELDLAGPGYSYQAASKLGNEGEIRRMAFARLGKAHHNFMLRSVEYLDFVLGKMGQSRKERTLALVPDSHHRLLPDQTFCPDQTTLPRFEQVANFLDSAMKLNFDMAIIDRFAPLDRVALEFHEVIYKILRDMKIDGGSSKLTRALVALLFADGPPAQKEFSELLNNAIGSLNVFEPVKDGDLNLELEALIISEGELVERGAELHYAKQAGLAIAQEVGDINAREAFAKFDRLINQTLSKYLVRKDVDVNFTPSESLSYRFPVRRGQRKCIFKDKNGKATGPFFNALLMRGMSMTALHLTQVDSFEPEYRGTCGVSLLMIAASQKDALAMEVLRLKHPYVINQRDQFGRSALDYVKGIGKGAKWARRFLKDWAASVH